MSDGPKIADRFILTSKKIGKGAFGNIYLGTDQLTNKPVAIKLVKYNIITPQKRIEYLQLYNYRKALQQSALN